MIHHIVFYWVDEPVEETRAKLLEGTRLLAEIPEALNFHAGPPLASQRGVVDHSYCIGMTMQYADAAAAQAYQVHPNHIRFAEEYFKPLVKRAVVYDL